MNKSLLTALLLLIASVGFANHIKGGFFTYKYLGPGTQDPAKLRYQVTLTVYMSCTLNSGQLTSPINFTIFDAGTNQFLQNVSVPITQQYTLSKGKDEECITGNQAICYYTIVVYDLPSIELASNANGYTFSYQRCCRIDGVQNISGGSSTIGNSYSITIPGSAIGNNAQKNNSATFLINDTAVICDGSFFSYPLTAIDPDGDQLSYSFCGAWVGGSQSNATPATAAAPPYAEVPYAGGYSSSQPLGSGVTINPATGLISGIAPPAGNTGEYVVTVCVNEIRNGVVIATTRKELHIKVGNCRPTQATLNPEYITCDGYTLTFSNNTPNTEINSYFWDFGVGNSTIDTSNIAVPTFTYSDTGVYTLKLVVNRGQNCSDSTTARVKVFPGFFPGFTHSGICVTKPTQFTDTTKTIYGVVDTWRWDFGNLTTDADTSRLQNPSYTYTQTGSKRVNFIVTNSKGCIDTVTKDIEIIDRPPLKVAFKDTLICVGDRIPLSATGNGNFTWTPANTLTNANTPTPTAQPSATTTYIVNLDDNGCKNSDSVRVRVVSFVSLQARGDTTICATDAVQLTAVSNGLRFQWTPATSLTNPAIINPVARPAATTTYQLRATIGGCSATDDVIVTAVPYPYAAAGNDTVICYGTAAQLNARITGNSFTWSPSSTLNNPASLVPIAFPAATTGYVLTVRDNIGCPKPGQDTVLVTVLPKMNVSAGNDTAVVIGQPLQLAASGGTTYLWRPGISLNNPRIFNPIAIYDLSFDSITYNVLIRTNNGCIDSASVTVHVFKTDPRIFVPTAFTPNNDGKNDVFNFIGVGISSIEYFRVYNRWGQLVFSTTINSRGWDGKIGGKEQGSGTYAWLVKGTDFTGKVVFAKGTVTLIR
jgi:gliding motility-associated-like protein